MDHYRGCSHLDLLLDKLTYIDLVVLNSDNVKMSDLFAVSQSNVCVRTELFKCKIIKIRKNVMTQFYK